MKFTIALRAGLALLTGSLLATGAGGQPAGQSPLTPPANGMKRADPTWHALTNATVHVSPGQMLQNATVVLREGRIVSVGEGESPAGARVWDCSGLHIYAGFIDAYVEVDAPGPAGGAAGTHWNSRVTPQRSALDGAGVDERTAESLRKLGFAAAVISPRGGVFRGSSATVSLAKPEADASADRPPVYAEAAYQSVAFESGGFGGGDAYPSSQMGAIALVRQTLIDEAWQRSARDGGRDIPENALDALAPWRGPDDLPSPTAHVPEEGGGTGPAQVPLLFDAGDELQALRAIKVTQEFSRPLVILGSGSEFKRLEAIAAAGKPGFILPVNFPRAPDVASVGKAEAVALEDLMMWEQAPTNPRRMRQAGLHVALTTARLRDRGQFAENLRKAIKHGLTPADALAGLTTVPATFANVKDLGVVAEGMRANLVVADGDLFAVREDEAKADAKSEPDAKPAGTQPEAEKKEADDRPDAETEGTKDDQKDAKIRDVWIDGVRHEINAAPDKSAAGLWKVTEADGQPMDPEAATTPRIIIDDRNAVTVQVGDKKVKATNVRILRGRIDYVYDMTEHGGEGLVADQATIDPSSKTMIGITRLGDGTIHRWKAVHAGEPPKEARAPRGGLAGRWEIRKVDGQEAGPEHQGSVTIGPDDSVTLEGHGRKATATDVKIEGDSLSYTVDMAAAGQQGFAKVTAKRAGDTLTGTVLAPDGETHTWEALRQPQQRPARPGQPEAEKAKEPKPDPIKEIPEKLGYPFGPYMMDELPPQEGVLVTNATIWTSGPQGIIKDGALVISGGKIVYVGPAASLPRLDGSHRTIDAAGKHVTPGLIDCHSHTGISGGVNEGAQSCTSEVRIGDVTNPDSINWYRQLAGGITAVNNLHGSANPIGGQNQVNKVRWGVPHPDDMHFEGAIPGIKFALGENVKRSRSSSNTRYPDTRMGVESFIRDRFTAAREYAAARAGDDPPRRDLELDCLAEILAGERLIHCHSYRQDEILMLARLSADFGFKLGTYQHGLECYKVADAVRESSRGASLFSDWWAYKVEVQDAIPQGGPILHEQGVVVSFNSDSDELARRMNVEAAKAVKYGALRPEEALKFVTINPAIQLDVADRVGSLEEGKDADFAIWSGDPLSSLSRCEATFIDGREYFALARDAEHRERIAAERDRLMQKVLRDGKRAPARPSGEGGAAGPPGGRGGRRPPSEADAVREYYMGRLQRGIDADAHVCGECGLGVEHAIQGGAR